MAYKLFNIIPGQSGEACILLYGEIGGWDDAIRSGDIVRELLELEAEYSRIDVRINSMGGEVYAGIAIFNALRNSKADVRIYIDGIAASMGSVIAASRRPLYMSKYARLMLHSVRGGAWGSTEDLRNTIKEIESLEDILADIYSDRTGKTKDEIKAMFFDGKDHWLSASEALALGLIDGIYDTEPVPEDSTPEQVYTVYQNRLKPNTNMLKDLLSKRPSFANLATDEAMLQHIEHLETEAGKVTGLSSEVTELKNQLQVYKDAEAEARKTEIAEIVNKAISENRIKEPQREVYVNLLTNDFENGKKALEALTPSKKVVDDLGNPTNQTSPWEKRMSEIKNNLKK